LDEELVLTDGRNPSVGFLAPRHLTAGSLQFLLAPGLMPLFCDLLLLPADAKIAVRVPAHGSSLRLIDRSVWLVKGTRGWPALRYLVGHSNRAAANDRRDPAFSLRLGKTTIPGN
jgi:hypothetical protein